MNNKKRYWKCWKCSSVGYTEGKFVDNSPSTMCCASIPIRTSGICGGSFSIEITEVEYNVLKNSKNGKN